MKILKKVLVLWISCVLALACVVMSACGKKGKEENQSATQGDNTENSIHDDVGEEFPDAWD